MISSSWNFKYDFVWDFDNIIFFTRWYKKLLQYWSFQWFLVQLPLSKLMKNQFNHWVSLKFPCMLEAAIIFFMVIPKANMDLIQAFIIQSLNSLTQKIKLLKMKSFLFLMKPLHIKCQLAHSLLKWILLEERNLIKKIWKKLLKLTLDLKSYLDFLSQCPEVGKDFTTQLQFKKCHWHMPRLNVKHMKSFWINSHFQNSVMTLFKEQFIHTLEAIGLSLLKNLVLTMFTKLRWVVELLNKLHTLMKAYQRWKVLTLTLILQQKQLLLSFLVTLRLIGTSIKEASIIAKKLRHQKLNFTLVGNLQELVIFMTGKPRLLTVQCQSVTNCFH